MNKFLLSILVLLLCACASAPTQEVWPAGIPDRAFYEARYWDDVDNQQEQTLDEYLTWVIRFYEGWIVYSRGWLQMMDEVDAALDDPQQQQQARQSMISIGQRVSAEWAKSNRVQRINTSNVSVWGNALIQALMENQSLAYIQQVSSDVDHLLMGKLVADDIIADRYFPEDPDDAFN